MALVKAKALGPWKVRVKQLRGEERWAVATEVDLGHCVAKRSDFFPEKALAEAAAEQRRTELRQNLVEPRWARTLVTLRPSPTKPEEVAEEKKEVLLGAALDYEDFT